MNVSPGTIAYRVLSALVEEPGERTVAILAKELGIPEPEVAEAVHAMSRAGLVAPRRYRRFPWARACAINTPLERRILALTQSVLLKRNQLAVALSVPETSGALREAIRNLHDYGCLSLPTEPWPSEAGIALVERLKSGAGER